MHANRSLPQSTGANLTKLADVLPGRDNNLNAIRMMAAMAVLVSHAWPITGNGATWTYVPANLSLQFRQYPLPGVFEGNLHGLP